LTLLEAMSVGCPTITVPCHGPEGIVKDGVTGLVLAERSSEALAQAMVQLARNPEWAARCGAAARAEVRKDFSMAAWRRRCLAEVEHVLRLPRPQGSRKAFAAACGLWGRMACASPPALLRCDVWLAQRALALLAGGRRIG
jgi:spore maturation protein CgeB